VHTDPEPEIATRLALSRGDLDHRQAEIDDAGCMIIERRG
jgi:hypothetical protein